MPSTIAPFLMAKIPMASPVANVVVFPSSVGVRVAGASLFPFRVLPRNSRRGTDGQRDGIAVAVCHIILITATACKEQGGAKADAGKIFFHEFHYIVLCG